MGALTILWFVAVLYNFGPQEFLLWISRDDGDSGPAVVWFRFWQIIPGAWLLTGWILPKHKLPPLPGKSRNHASGGKAARNHSAHMTWTQVQDGSGIVLQLDPRAAWKMTCNGFLLEHLGVFEWNKAKDWAKPKYFILRCIWTLCVCLHDCLARFVLGLWTFCTAYIYISFWWICTSYRHGTE